MVNTYYKTHLVFLNADGTVWFEDTDHHTGESTFTIMSDHPTRDNYIFDAWETGGKLYYPGSKLVLPAIQNYTITLTPTWRQNSATVHFDTQGGNAVPDVVYSHGQEHGTVTFALPTTVPTREDYAFEHWYYNTAHYNPGDSITMGYSEYRILTAVWKRTTYYTTVVYNANGGTGVPPTQTEAHRQTEGTVTVYLNNDTFPTKEGWIFGGWTVKGEVKAPGSAIVIGYNEEITVYAYWYQNTARIEYLSPEGTVLLDPTVRKNAKTEGTVAVTVRSDIPLRKYFKFDSWLDSDGVSYDPGSTATVPCDGTLTLTAVFERLTVTLTLVSDRGDGTKVYHPQQGTQYALPSPTAEGYLFKGWSETDGGLVRYLPGSTLAIETQDVTLFAVWNTEYNEEVLTLADGTTRRLEDVTVYPQDRRTVEVGTGAESVYLSTVGYPNIQFVPRSLVEKYPLAFGISPTDMDLRNNPDVTYSNAVDADGKMTVLFPSQVGGYSRDSVSMAVVDLASMNAFILTCFLAQETDTTVYSIRLLKTADDPSPTVVSGLVGSYRNPYVFVFPMFESDDGRVLDRWVSQDTGLEYCAGDTLSLTGRYVTPSQTLTFIARMADRVSILKFALKGGRNGPNALTRITSGESVTFTIPESGITRRGHAFLGWSGTANGAPEYQAGDTVTVKAGLAVTLYAVWRASSTPFSVQGKLYLPYCGIRIWKDEDAYFNATFFQTEGGLAVISKAENRPGSATFTLVNDYNDPGRNLCADTFALWSDGSTGGIVPGMYVELLNIRTATDAVRIMDGRITTMTSDGETVSVEVGDGITFLSRTGTWLRRNYRNANETQKQVLDGYIEDGSLKVDLSQYDGTPSAVYRLHTEEVAVSLTKDTSGGPIISAGSQKYLGTIQKTVGGTSYSRLRRIRFKVRWSVYVEYGVATLAPSVKIATSDQHYDRTYPKTEISSTGSKEYEWSLVGCELSGDADISIQLNLYGANGGMNTGDWSIEECCVYVDTQELIAVTSDIYVDSNPDQYDLTDPSARLIVNYERGTITNTILMKQIAEAIGYNVALPDGIPQKKLATFRAGGAYAQTYLQKLADQSDNGRAYSYSVDGSSPTLNIGMRYLVGDPPKLIAKYGGDTAPSGYDATVVDISDFNPTLTFKNRPNLVTFKAVLSDSNQSVTVCFENPASTTVRNGITVEDILTDSSASTLQGLGNAAYAELISTDLDRWEGEVTIPGIVWGVMSEGDPDHAGSGVPILIQDSRFGMNSFRTRARQVEYNYNTCTTKITLGNYDIQYSSSIAKTNALAVGVSDMVGGISDTTLYNQQFVYLKTAAIWAPGADNTMSIKTVDGAVYGVDQSQIFELPYGYVFVGTIEANATNCLDVDKPYGITQLILSGKSTVTIEIPESRRPDFYLGQKVMICVLVCKN